MLPIFLALAFIVILIVIKSSPGRLMNSPCRDG